MDTFSFGELVQVTRDRPSLAGLSAGDVVLITDPDAPGMPTTLEVRDDVGGTWWVGDDEVRRIPEDERGMGDGRISSAP